MGAVYEFTKKDIGVPVSIKLHSIKHYKMHWHREFEIIMVLKGSVNIYIKDDSYILKENDVIVVNFSEPHSLGATDEDNIILSLKLDMKYHDKYYKNFSKLQFDCKSFEHENQDKFDIIRHCLAKVVWELDKSQKGHSFRIASTMYKLGGHMIENFDYTKLELDKILADEDIIRMNKIIDYIEENYTKNITLQDIANEIGLSTYYTSHFIKKILGIGFTEYIGNIRLENAALYLSRTDKSITEIALENGYGSIKSFNNNFKNKYKITPSEYRNETSIKVKDIYKLTSTENSEDDYEFLERNKAEALNNLYSFIEKEEVELLDKIDYEIVSIYTNKDRIKLNNDYNWKQVIAISDGIKCLNHNKQEQIKNLQKDLRFKYAGIKHIFDKEMIDYKIISKDEIIFDWRKIDELLDFLTDVKLRPAIELDFRHEYNPDYEDDEFIENLVSNFFIHIINRYGIYDVRNWYFKVPNNPNDKEGFKERLYNKYFNEVHDIIKYIKNIDDKLLVGTEIIFDNSESSKKYYSDFLDYCIKNNIELEFISLYMKNKYEGLANQEKILEDYVSKIEKQIKDGKLKDCRILLWNLDLSRINSDKEYEKCFVAIHVIDNIISLLNNKKNLRLDLYSDLNNDFILGNFKDVKSIGLLDAYGIKNPLYHAYKFLDELGDEIIEFSDNYIVTRKMDNIQILAYNYKKNLEDEVGELHYRFKIKDIKGKYKILRYELNNSSGSSHDLWKEIGSPENMNLEEISYLKNKSIPKMSVNRIEKQNKKDVDIDISLFKNSLELIVLEKEY